MQMFAGPCRIGLILLAFAAPPAAARERPGTPAHAAMSLAGPDTLRMIWINTRRVGQDGAFTERTYFDVEGQTDPSRPEFGVNPILGQQVTYDIAGLAHGRHCFRAWSRESPNGVRSEVPGAWACGTIPGPQLPSRSGAAPAVGAVLSNQPFLVWVAPMLYYQGRQPSSVDEGQFEDAGLTRQTGGAFLVTAASASCAYPWRRVVYQYGGWPGLGPAGFTGRGGAYGLCWYPHVPTAAESVVPRPPVSPPAVGGGRCTTGSTCP